MKEHFLRCGVSDVFFFWFSNVETPPSTTALTFSSESLSSNGAGFFCDSPSASFKWRVTSDLTFSVLRFYAIFIRTNLPLERLHCGLFWLHTLCRYMRSTYKSRPGVSQRSEKARSEKSNPNLKITFGTWAYSLKRRWCSPLPLSFPSRSLSLSPPKQSGR